MPVQRKRGSAGNPCCCSDRAPPLTAYLREAAVKPRTSSYHEVASSAVAHVLRDVAESDIDAFYEHQREPEATEMAHFPARDREAFDAHWQRLLADDSVDQEDDRPRGAGRRKHRLLGEGRAAPDRLLGRQGVLGPRPGDTRPGRVRRGSARVPSTRGWQEATSARSASSRSAASSRWAPHRARRERRPAGRGGPLRARLAALAIAEAGRRVDVCTGVRTARAPTGTADMPDRVTTRLRTAERPEMRLAGIEPATSRSGGARSIP